MEQNTEVGTEHPASKKISKPFRSDSKEAVGAISNKVLDMIRNVGNGQYMMVNKYMLNIDVEYQRDISMRSVGLIEACFSMMVFGVLTVARRKDGGLYVIDGQHRLMAARRIDSVKTVPCMVFDVESFEVEAAAFAVANSIRKSVVQNDSYRALIAAGDETYVKLKGLLQNYHLISVKRAQNAREITASANLAKMVKGHPEEAELVISVLSAIAETGPCVGAITGGVISLCARLEGGFSGNPHVLKALKSLEYHEIMAEIKRAVQKRGDLTNPSGIVSLKLYGEVFAKLVRRHTRKPFVLEV